MSSERNSKGEHGNGAAGTRNVTFLNSTGVSRPKLKRHHHQRLPTKASASRNNTTQARKVSGFNVGSHQRWVLKSPTHHYGLPSDSRVGNRGTTRFQWQRGPREPPEPNGGRQKGTPTTVFVDNLHQHMAREWLLDVFSEYGKVEDIYISKKIRETKRDAFGFVRYRRKLEALEAIKNLNGREVKGKSMVVSMAKYYKGGALIKRPIPMEHEKRIKYPAFRDGRRYAEVVQGKQGEQGNMLRVQHRDSQQAAVTRRKWTGSKDMGRAPLSATGGCPNNQHVEAHNIGHTITLNVTENATVKDKLKTAIVVGVDEMITPTQAADLVVEANINCAYFSSLTSFSFVLFFESIVEMNKALDKSSPLWKHFKFVRRWSDEMEYMDRVACLECYGIHPTCWEIENIKKIGELWGMVLHVDNDINGVNNLTYARLLVRTEAQFRIDTRIKLAWEHGKSEIWVKECQYEYGTHVLGKNQLVCDDDEDSLHEYGEGQGSFSKSRVSETCENTMEPQVNHHGGLNLDTVVGKVVDPILLDIIKKPMDNPSFQPSIAQHCVLHPECLTDQFTPSKWHPYSLPSEQPQGVHGVGLSIQLLSEEEEPTGIKSWQPVVLGSGLENSDPVILERMLISAPENIHQHFDPIQTVEWESPRAVPQQHTEQVEVRTGTLSKKSRGRPKKNLRDLENDSALIPWDSEEAHSTWNTVKMVGVTSKQEHGMVSKIRKSKRLLQLGDSST